VISGYPVFYALSLWLSLSSTNWMYLFRALDALLYIALPQINVTLIRLWQGRNLLHRMVGRTVVIGDIPWVAQCAEAFLSKLFACSYSIAGLNVLSGNPADHFVHRHTHRVVRGSLIICGRPDGRLSALASAEASVCLSVSQASSIQSWGGTCESITIGHNPFKLSLTEKGIFLKRKRPMFLCERMLAEKDVMEETKVHDETKNGLSSSGQMTFIAVLKSCCCYFSNFARMIDKSMHSFDGSLHRDHLDMTRRPKILKVRNSVALLGSFANMENDHSASIGRTKKGKSEQSNKELVHEDEYEDFRSVDRIIAEKIKVRKFTNKKRILFQALDVDQNGVLDKEEFLLSLNKIFSGMDEDEALRLFAAADEDATGSLSFDEFLKLTSISSVEQSLRIPCSNRNERGIIEVECSVERYFGENLRKQSYAKAEKKKKVDFALARSQHLCQELYETRIASLQRFVAMTVMFHQMGLRVQTFFRKISFGFWGYRMDRTHSIMRVATTASPVSGADVRDQIAHIQIVKKIDHSINVISTTFLRYKENKEKVV